jgi:hypothetical protein
VIYLGNGEGEALELSRSAYLSGTGEVTTRLLSALELLGSGRARSHEIKSNWQVSSGEQCISQSRERVSNVGRLLMGLMRINESMRGLVGWVGGAFFPGARPQSINPLDIAKGGDGVQ